MTFQRLLIVGLALIILLPLHGCCCFRRPHCDCPPQGTIPPGGNPVPFPSGGATIVPGGTFPPNGQGNALPPNGPVIPGNANPPINGNPTTIPRSQSPDISNSFSSPQINRVPAAPNWRPEPNDPNPPFQVPDEMRVPTNPQPNPNDPLQQSPGELRIYPDSSGKSPMQTGTPPRSTSWQAGEIVVQLGKPIPVTRDFAPQKPSASAYPPQTPQLKNPIWPDQPTPARRPLPSGSAEKPKTPIKQPAHLQPSTGLPVGIPEYAVAKNNIAAGLRPMLGGLDWLRDKGYRTVLHLVPPGMDDSADRKQVEKRGMTYFRLEISPSTLTQTDVQAFNRLIADSSTHPLFVYDRDGALAGGMWYLYFRLEDGANHELARSLAGSLGLRETGDGTHLQMWRAVQDYLNR